MVGCFVFEPSSANRREKITIYLPYLSMVQISLEEALTIPFLAELIKNEEERVNYVSTVDKGLRSESDKASGVR
jgi:hypothetical protein